MRTALLSLTFLLAGSMAAPAFAHTAAPKKKVTATTKKGKILPMKEYIDQLMAKMTLQEKIGQLNLMVAGDITTGGALDTQVGSDIAQGNALGILAISKAPCKGKSFVYWLKFESFCPYRATGLRP